MENGKINFTYKNIGRFSLDLRGPRLERRYSRADPTAKVRAAFIEADMRHSLPVDVVQDMARILGVPTASVVIHSSHTDRITGDVM